MRIVKPYGETRAEPVANKTRFERVLYRNDGDAAPVSLDDFTRTHPGLVIAQWISIIDKIATKPSGTKGASQDQRDFRNRLGNAAWKILVRNGRLSKEAVEDERTKKLWQFKIHPYGDAKCRPRKNASGGRQTGPNPKGRWYRRFAGDVDVKQANVEDIACKIDSHLHVAELRRTEATGSHKTGLIERRAKSIASNTLRLASEKAARSFECAWNEDHRKQYFAAGDVAQVIWNAAKKKHEDILPRPN